MANETYSGTTGTAGHSGVWRPRVLINGVDVSSRVVGDLRIDAEEGSARIAELTVRPADGTAFAITEWVGKSLSIDIEDWSSGNAAAVSRLFTGLIDTPTLDFEQRTIRLLGTDNLQNSLEVMSAAAIDALIPGGYSSPVIFNPAAQGWARAQDRLSTTPASLDLNPLGVPRLTSWTPAGSPALSLTDAHLIDKSVAVALTSRHQMVNSVTVDFAYRFPRTKAEGYPLTYSYVSETNLSEHAQAGNSFLLRTTVEAAIKAAGGTIQSITYTPMPNQVVGSWVPTAQDIFVCMGFSALVSFDYFQTIEEQHVITVSAPNSIGAIGTMTDRLSGALEGEYPQVTAAETAILLYRNAISSIPPQDAATPVSGSTVAADVTLTTDTDRAAANAAMQTLIAMAKVRIWASHRRNAVSASVALNPAIDLTQTIDLTTPGLHARGKCRSVTHLLSPDTGLATTEFSIAICSVAGVGITHPDTPTTAPAGSAPATTVLSGSAAADFNFLQSEDHVFTVTFPGVEAAERNKANIPLASAYSAPLTEDIFTLTL